MKKILVILMAGFLTLLNPVNSYALPIACDGSLYLSQAPGGGSTQPATLYEIATATNPFTITSVYVNPYNYNALGINPLDQTMYGITFPGNHLLQFNSMGVPTDLGVVAGLPNYATASEGFVSGAFDDLGNFYVKGNASTFDNFFRIDVSTMTAVNIPLVPGALAAFDPNDFAYSSTDNLLYTQTVDGLVSINPVTGALNVIGGNATQTAGAMYSSDTGEVFGNINNGNGFVQYDLATGNQTVISASQGAQFNDGASCGTIQFAADLSVTKTDNMATYRAGTPVVYTIVVRNEGPFGVLGATVQDQLPAGIADSNVSWTATASAGVDAQLSGAGTVNQRISMPSGGTVTYTLTVNVPADYNGDLYNTARIDAPSNIIDSNLSNNIASDLDTVDTPAATESLAETGTGITNIIMGVFAMFASGATLWLLVRRVSVNR